MRIISGKLKGRRLIAPKNLLVRPTTGFAKEALFNLLDNDYYFNAISVIDLFSGTGNISYEFASRNTKNITAVDINYNCIKYIYDTSKNLNLNINICKSDVYKFLEKTKLQADIIFADPPYGFNVEKFLKIIDLVIINKILIKNGTLIIEHSKHLDLSNHQNFIKSKRYSSNIFSFFKD